MSLTEQARAACWAGIQSQGFCFSGDSDSLQQVSCELLCGAWLVLDDIGVCVCDSHF